MKFSTHIAEFEPPIPNPQPFLDKASALYEKIVASKLGKVVFVVGELGRGKTEIMSSIADFFKQANPTCNVIDGCFIEGKYEPYIPKVNVDVTKTIDTIGNIASAMAKFVSPRFAAFLDLGGQLLQTGAANIDFVKSHTANPPQMPETPYWLLQVLRETAKQKPLVCVIDDFDEAQERFGWNSFLLSLAEEIAVDLPILFVVSMTEKAEVGEHKVGENNLEYVTRELVGRGLAEWWYLKPMSREEIAEWITLETSIGIVSQLHGMTGGNTRWVQTLWREWRVNENVVFNEHHRVWEWSKDKKPELNQLKGSFEDLLKTLLQTDELPQTTEAKKILGLAALEGRSFTAEVLALALGKDTDELINYLDDNFVLDDSRPNGILLENGFVEIELAPNVKMTLCRYKFVSDWHWQILDRYAFPSDEEKFKYAAEMIQALKIVFETNERFIAKSLARLYRILKDDESARNYQQIADFATNFENARELALQLIEIDTTNWDKFRCQQLTWFLFKAGKTIQGANPYENLAIFEKAVELAEKANDTETQAKALYWVAKIYADFGKIQIAEEKARLCQKLFANFNDRLFEAIVCSLLGYIAEKKGRWEEAEPLHKKALVIKETVLGENHLDTGVSYSNLALLYKSQCRYEEAELLLKKALAICKKILGENHLDTATNYHNLALIYRLQGRYEEAEPLYQKALAIREKFLGENHLATATSYSSIGWLYEDIGKYLKAKEYFEKALAIRRKILGNQHCKTTITQHHLERVKIKLGDK